MDSFLLNVSNAFPSYVLLYHAIAPGGLPLTIK